MKKIQFSLNHNLRPDIINKEIFNFDLMNNIIQIME